MTPMAPMIPQNLRTARGASSVRHLATPALGGLSRPGFTLLELLVAMGMAAMVIGAVAASLAVGFKAQESAEAAVEPGRTFELANEIMRADFEAAIPPNTSTPASTSASGAGAGGAGGTGGGTGGGASGGISSSSSGSSDTTTTLNSQMMAGAFTGYNDSVNFFSVADSPDHVDGNGEIKWVAFAVEVPQGSSDRVLVRQVMRNVPPLTQSPILTSQSSQTSQTTSTAQAPAPAPAAPPPDEEVICRGVSNFMIEYFDGTDWQQTWDPTQYNNTLPAAVRVTLELNRTDRNGKPTVIRNISVFSLPCSTNTYNATTGTNGSSGSSGLGGF